MPFQFTKGFLKPQEAAMLNKMLARLAALDAADPVPPLTRIGDSLALDTSAGAIAFNMLIPAMITGGTNPYNWIEVQAAPGGSGWIPTPGGRSGGYVAGFGQFYPAYEFSGNQNVPINSVVGLVPGAWGGTAVQDYRFAFCELEARVRITSQTTAVMTSAGLAEVQTITVPAQTYGGTFVTSIGTFNGTSTLAAAQAVLDAWYGAGNTVATGGPLPNPIVVTWPGTLAVPIGPQTVITVPSSSLLPALTPALEAVITETTKGVAQATYNAYPGEMESVNPYTLATSDAVTCWVLNLESSAVPPIAASEVQILAITGGTPSSGAFSIGFDGQVTAGTLAYNESASAAQTAADGLSTIGSGNMTCTGGALPGTAISFTFSGTLANLPQNLMTVSGSTLSAGTAAFTRSVAGTLAIMEGYLLGYDENGVPVYSVGVQPSSGAFEGEVVLSVNPGTGDSTISLTNTTIQADLASGLGVVSESGVPKILLQAASDTHAGGWTTTTQTLAGNKTINCGLFQVVYTGNSATLGFDPDVSGATYVPGWVQIYAADGGGNDYGIQFYPITSPHNYLVHMFGAGAGYTGGSYAGVYAVQDAAGTGYFGRWATDPDGGVFSGGLCTTASTLSGINETITVAVGDTVVVENGKIQSWTHAS
jgi:hypothetical protein